MIQIDMQRLRDAFPKRGTISLKFAKNLHTPRSLYIECICRWPGLYDKGTKAEEEELNMVLKWQREIIPKEAIAEFFTEETGSHWLIYLKRIPLEFVNCTNEDVETYTGYTVDQLKHPKEG